jgi:hypothetical protein
MRLALQTVGQLKRVATSIVILSIGVGYVDLLARWVS